MLDAGGRLDLSARGDGGTPLDRRALLGAPRGRPAARPRARQPARRGRARRFELIDELAGTPRPARTARFYRPHGGFPAWEPSDDPQEVLDEALVWAAKADRVEALAAARRARRTRRGRPLPRHGAHLGGGERPRRLRSGSSSELGADPNQRGTFGGPDHGEGVTALHLAAQAGESDAVETLLELGADPTIRDGCHDGDTGGLGRFGGHGELAEQLQAEVDGERVFV